MGALHFLLASDSRNSTTIDKDTFYGCNSDLSPLFGHIGYCSSNTFSINSYRHLILPTRTTFSSKSYNDIGGGGSDLLPRHRPNPHLDTFGVFNDIVSLELPKYLMDSEYSPKSFCYTLDNPEGESITCRLTNSDMYLLSKNNNVYAGEANYAIYAHTMMSYSEEERAKPLKLITLKSVFSFLIDCLCKNKDTDIVRKTIESIVDILQTEKKVYWTARPLCVYYLIFDKILDRIPKDNPFNFWFDSLEMDKDVIRYVKVLTLKILFQLPQMFSIYLSGGTDTHDGFPFDKFRNIIMKRPPLKGLIELLYSISVLVTDDDIQKSCDEFDRLTLSITNYVTDNNI